MTLPQASTTLGAALLLAALALAPVQAATGPELVVNGGFETGDFSGWSSALGPFSGVDSFAAHDGDYGAFGGEVDVAGSLGQTLATAAGTVYEIRFWLRSDGLAPNQFSVSWDGNPVYSAIDLAASDYTEHVLLHSALGASTSLVFEVRNDNGFLEFDDISVRAVPEPGSVVMFGAGLAALAWRRRRPPVFQPG